MVAYGRRSSSVIYHWSEKLRSTCLDEISTSTDRLTHAAYLYRSTPGCEDKTSPISRHIYCNCQAGETTKARLSVARAHVGLGLPPDFKAACLLALIVSRRWSTVRLVDLKSMWSGLRALHGATVLGRGATLISHDLFIVPSTDLFIVPNPWLRLEIPVYRDCPKSMDRRFRDVLTVSS